MEASALGGLKGVMGEYLGGGVNGLSDMQGSNGNQIDLGVPELRVGEPRDMQDLATLAHQQFGQARNFVNMVV